MSAQRYWNDNATFTLTPRTKDQLARFFDGLDLLEPGLVSMSRWRPETIRSGEPPEVAGYSALGRKP
jgi:hypothetical protein